MLIDLLQVSKLLEKLRFTSFELKSEVTQLEL